MFILLSSNSNAQIVIDQAGKIGLGTETPDQAVDIRGYVNFVPSSTSTLKLMLDLSGYYSSPSLHPTGNNIGNIGNSNLAYHEVWSYSHATPSDSRQKENIRDISKPLELIMQIKGVQYDIKREYIKTDSFSAKYRFKFENERKDKIGFLAQDIQKVLPQVVSYDDSTDTYGIDYSKVVPVLVEAVKAQQLLIDNMQNELKKVKQNADKSAKKEQNKDTENTDEAILFQNTPNPFDVSTSIAYYLPLSTKKASITVYDMQGNPKKQFPLFGTGHGSIEITGTTLFEGMYMYTLIADGQEVDTKRMILTNK